MYLYLARQYKAVAVHMLYCLTGCPASAWLMPQGGPITTAQNFNPDPKKMPTCPPPRCEQAVLQAQGIVPSDNAQYDLKDVKSAIVASFGVDVQVHCNAKAELTEVGVEGVDVGKESVGRGFGCCGLECTATPRPS